MTWGMDMAFIVRNGKTAETSMKGPPAYMPPCTTDSLYGALQSFLQHEA